MRLLALLTCLLGMAFPALQAAPPALPSRTVVVAPMKTSIYIGSVKLNTGVFTWQGEGFATTYEAKVTPWFFWGESGSIIIKLSHDSLGRLAMGETVEFTGEAVNSKQKTRQITGRAQPATPTTGKIKVRIMADGIELIFNSTYEFKHEAALDNPPEIIGTK